MKPLINIGFTLLLAACTSSQKIDYASFKDCQNYSLPAFEPGKNNKVVLFVFPHADDEIVCAGTIMFLKEKGYKTCLLTLTKGNVEEKQTRSAEWKNAAKLLKLDESEIYDLPNNKWEDVLSDKITFWYTNKDSVKNIIYRTILKHNPSLIITYDSALGGYGHPEHRISAQLVAKIFSENRNNSLFPVKQVLQITLPEKMENKMLSGSEPYLNAKKITGNTTLPEPNFAVNISQQWPIKCKAALCYESQLNTLKKFKLIPSEKDTLMHYKTFDLEYFTELK